MLKRLLENAPELVPGRAHGRSHVDLRGRRRRRSSGGSATQGFSPRPPPAQLDYIRELAEELEMDEADAARWGGPPPSTRSGTSGRASTIIDELSALYDERMPPSAKQRRFIEGLVEQVGIPEAEAAALVGVASFEDLTGGAGGDGERAHRGAQGAGGGGKEGGGEVGGDTW
jgi:hypothetical protein